MGLPSLEEDCSSDVREGGGGGEAVWEEDGVRLSAFGDDLGGEEFMEDGCRNGRKGIISRVQVELVVMVAYLALPTARSSADRRVETTADPVVACPAASARRARRGGPGGGGGGGGSHGHLLLLVLQRDRVPLDELPDLVLRPRPLILVLPVRQLLQK